MKRILLSLLVVTGLVAAVAGATSALFSDTETLGANTFSTGSLDLEVEGENDPISFTFSGDLVPGETYNAGTVELENVGTLEGMLTMMVSNPVSNENGIVEPEEADGDLPGTEIDPTGYDANGGDGELWDMVSLKFYVDLNDDGVMQWNEPVIYSGPMGVDMTSYYSIPLDTDLFPSSQHQGFDDILGPGETAKIGLLVKFFDDGSSPMTSQPQYNGLTNNMAMTDDIVFDIIFGLEQIVTP